MDEQGDYDQADCTKCFRDAGLRFRDIDIVDVDALKGYIEVEYAIANRTQGIPRITAEYVSTQRDFSTNAILSITIKLRKQDCSLSMNGITFITRPKAASIRFCTDLAVDEMQPLYIAFQEWVLAYMVLFRKQKGE